MATIRMRAARTGEGFPVVIARFKRNVAVLPERTADNIAWAARQMAPVWHGMTNPGVTGHAHSYPVPGELRDSIVAINATVLVQAYYGIYVEFGTRYMHQEPFLRPACQLVFRTQFRHDVQNLFREDISLGTLEMYASSPMPIAYAHARHRMAHARNRTRSVAQRRYEVRRRFAHGMPSITRPVTVRMP